MLKGNKLYPEKIILSDYLFVFEKYHTPSKNIIENWNILSAASSGKGCYSSECIPHLA